MTNGQSPTIFTVGHGLLESDALLANLHEHAIGLVVDVRSQPFSGRAPHFNSTQLESSLGGIGIEYIWEGDRLGGRPSPDLCTAGGAPDYERMAREPGTERCLDDLAERANIERVALLCSESQPEGCHRSRMLEPELEKRGVRVQHILPTGSLAETPTLFA